MTTRPQTSPHIKDGYSPLSALIMRALRLFGETAPDAADDDDVMMMLDLANEVIDEIRAHPYWAQISPAIDLQYYVHPTQSRPVPDMIMLAGIRYLYAEQQASAKAPGLAAKYYRALNSHLWQLVTGENGSQPLALRTVDGGTNPKVSVPTSAITGQPIITE